MDSEDTFFRMISGIFHDAASEWKRFSQQAIPFSFETSVEQKQDKFRPVSFEVHAQIQDNFSKREKSTTG